MILLRKLILDACLIFLSSVGFLIAFQPVSASLNCSPSASAAWLICGPVESYPGFDLQPATLSASDGTLWLAWTANHNAGGVLTSNFNVLYATRLTNGTWLAPSSLTTRGGQNQMPALAQTSGTVYIFWTYKNTTSTHPHSQIYYRTFNGNTWSPYTQVTTTTSMNDTGPSAAVGPDGTLWLAWTRDNDTASGSTSVMRQLWYKTLKNSVWSPDANITSPSDVNWNWQPSLMVGKDGVPRMAFARGQSSTGHYQINYMTYGSGKWSLANPIVSLCTGSSCTGDLNPSIMQDRNGTLWLFWSRNLVVSSTLSNYVIYGKYSVDNGANWSSIETAITPVSCGLTSCVDSQYPAAVQSNISTDQNIWVFDSMDPPSTNSFDIWGLKTLNPIYPIHDVSVSAINQPNAFQYPGGFSTIGQSANVTVSVTVRDLGDFPESVTVTLTVTNTTQYRLSPSTVQLIAGGTAVLRLNWTTVFDGTKPGWYDVSAVAGIVPGETLGNSAHNIMNAKHSIHILPPGDVDQDGSTTANDVSQVKYAYGAQPCSFHPENPICYLYNPYFDISGSGTVDAVAVSVAIAHYGIFT
jgi:hypothetical protein